MRSLSLLLLAMTAPAWGLDLNAPVLNQSAGYEFRFAPLSQVFAQLRKETGLSLVLDSKLGSRRLTAFVTNQPRNQFMLRMAEALGAEWVPGDAMLKLRLKEDVVQYEVEVDKSFATSSRLMLRDWIALSKGAERPYAETMNELMRIDQALADLRRDRPAGWGDQFTNLEKRRKVIQPLKGTPAIFSFLRATRNWPITTWQQVAAGKRQSVWVPQEGLAGGKWMSVFGVPYLGNIYISGSNAPVVDAFDLPKSNAPRRLPTGPGRGIERGLKTVSDTGLNPFLPGDIDVLEEVHRLFGVDCVMEGLRTRGLYLRLGPGLVRELLDRLGRLAKQNEFELRLDGDWVTYVPKDIEVWRRSLNDSDLMSSVERTGVNDIAALTRFGTSFVGRRDDVAKSQAQITMSEVVGQQDLFDFLGSLSPRQIDNASRGLAIPYSDMSPLTRNLFRQFTTTRIETWSLEPSPNVDKFEWENEPVRDPEAWNRMSFYLERYGRDVAKRETGPGKSMTGGINDGIVKLNSKATPFFEYELNFYFGIDFKRSMKHTVRISTAVPPPPFKADPSVNPPEHHEGHGPGL